MLSLQLQVRGINCIQLENISHKQFDEFYSCLIDTYGYKIWDFGLGQGTDNYTIFSKVTFLKYMDFEIQSSRHDQGYITLNGYSQKYQKGGILVYKKLSYQCLIDKIATPMFPDLYYFISSKNYIDNREMEYHPHLMYTQEPPEPAAEKKRFIYLVSQKAGVTLTKFEIGPRSLVFNTQEHLKDSKNYLMASRSIIDEEESKEGAHAILYRLDILLQQSQPEPTTHSVITVNLVFLSIMVSLTVFMVCLSIWVDVVKFFERKMNVVRIRRETSILDHLRTTSEHNSDSLMDVFMQSEASEITLQSDISNRSSERLDVLENAPRKL